MTTFRSTNAKERFIYHTAGLDGTGSGSYIDDVVLCDADMNSGWTSAADSTKEVRRTYLQNWRHDIVVVLDASGRLLENVKYLSYGTPFACPAGDTELKGSWQSSDSTRISSYAGSYDIRFDPTHNGVIDAADITYANSIKSGYQTLGLGVLSSTAVANRKGYAGYEHAPELAGTKWHVRNRVLDAELGRWTRRDPMGYHDGPNLYPYVFSSPLSYVDPNGAQIRLPGHGVDPEIGPLPPIPGGVDPLPPHPGGIVCNLTSHDIVVCGTDLLHRPQPCIVLHPGECSAQQLEDADFWFIPGHGWYKCRWNSWCSPSDVEPDDGWPGRPWHPDDHPLITWPMPTLPSTCDNFCRSLANGTPDPCLAWSVCMAQCMQAGQPGVPGVPNCPFTPNDPGRQIAGVGGVGGM